uniref:Uncharacterized protein n=1 Tax=Nelumbo nucifera TaxID=4432 RepID=A0A822XSB2_NELNU|nr:TPA_asm: hypothetical protein HUJ06_021831 [Nelumbo nucifera]
MFPSSLQPSTCIRSPLAYAIGGIENQQIIKKMKKHHNKDSYLETKQARVVKEGCYPNLLFLTCK